MHFDEVVVRIEATSQLSAANGLSSPNASLIEYPQDVSRGRSVRSELPAPGTAQVRTF